MQSLSLLFSWAGSVDSSLDCETCSLTLLVSWENEGICLFCGMNDRNRNVIEVVLRCYTHTQILGVDICQQFQLFYKRSFYWGWAFALCLEWLCDSALASPSPPPQLYFFFQTVYVCAGTRWVEQWLEWWLQKLLEDFSQLKIQSGSFWCRLAENCKMVLHDKEEPWVCSVSCAHVLESPQLINSNYF